MGNKGARFLNIDLIRVLSSGPNRAMHGGSGVFLCFCLVLLGNMLVLSAILGEIRLQMVQEVGDWRVVCSG